MSESEIATLKSEMVGMRRDFEKHDEKDDENQRVMYGKLDTINRMLWTGFGGVIVIGGVIAMIGAYIIKLLAR